MSQSSHTTMVDVETGVVGQFRPIQKPKRGGSAKPRPGNGFLQVFPDALIACGLSGAQLEVLMVLASEMDQDTGLARYLAHDIAERLHIATVESVYRLIRQLAQRGAVIRDTRYNGVLIVNPNVLWRGKAELRDLAVFEWENLTRASA